MANYKISSDELDFMLAHVPAFGVLAEKERRLFASIMAKVNSTASVVQMFYFPINKNPNTKVMAIKLIRQATGMGLKEAKDAFEAQHHFSLTDWKMSKELLMTNIETLTGYANATIKVEFV
jgi:ribosomal protein L7/L12